MQGYFEAVSWIALLVVPVLFVAAAMRNQADELIWLIGGIAIFGMFAQELQQRRLRRELEAVITLLDQDDRFGVRRR
jgi:hypothetical protein